jgi:hypothetical protein
LAKVGEGEAGNSSYYFTFFFFLARLKLFQNESMRELVIALRESDNSEEYEHIEVLEQFSMSVWIGVHGVRRYLNSTKQ